MKSKTFKILSGAFAGFVIAGPLGAVLGAKAAADEHDAGGAPRGPGASFDPNPNETIR